jgi:hypothetical protein
MATHEETLRTFVSWLNNWALSGTYSHLLGMFHPNGRIHIGGAYGAFRYDTRAEVEAFLRDGKPLDSLDLTHTSDNPIGATATFRWSKQAEDAEAGTIVIELVDDMIIRLVWEFLPTTRHPVPWLKAGQPATLPPIAAAPLAAPAARTVAAPAEKASPTKPVFL